MKLSLSFMCLEDLLRNVAAHATDNIGSSVGSSSTMTLNYPFQQQWN